MVKFSVYLNRLVFVMGMYSKRKEFLGTFSEGILHVGNQIGSCKSCLPCENDRNPPSVSVPFNYLMDQSNF